MSDHQFHSNLERPADAIRVGVRIWHKKRTSDTSWTWEIADEFLERKGLVTHKNEEQAILMKDTGVRAAYGTCFEIAASSIVVSPFFALLAARNSIADDYRRIRLPSKYFCVESCIYYYHA